MIFKFFETESSKTDKKSELILKLWNRYAVKCGYTKVRGLTTSRRFNLNVLYRQYNKSDLRHSLKLLEQCQWLSTTTWFTFDWVINENNFIKFIEGKYVRRFNGCTNSFSGGSKVRVTETRF